MDNPTKFWFFWLIQSFFPVRNAQNFYIRVNVGFDGTPTLQPPPPPPLCILSHLWCYNSFMTFASIFVNNSLHWMISLVQSSLCLSRRKYQKHGKFRLNNIMQFDSCCFHSNQIQPFKVFRKYLHYIAAQWSVYNFNVLSTKHLCTFQCSTKGPVFGNVSGNN